MNLSKYITESEFVLSQTAVRLGIDNTMNDQQRADAVDLCTHFIDAVQDYYKKPVSVTSGYRCEKLNEYIGGSRTSNHCLGNAMDFTVKDIPLKSLFNDIASGKIKFIKPFDELIFEFDSWVHLARRDFPRKKILRAYKIGGSTVYKDVLSV